MDLRELTAENTKPLVGTTFRLEFSDGKSLELTLDRVQVLYEKHSSRMKRDSFGMYFVGPPDIYIKQGMYPTFHETLGGPLPIFYVPIQRRQDGCFEFEAIFT
jgi:hypothetical protein